MVCRRSFCYNCKKYGDWMIEQFSNFIKQDYKILICVVMIVYIDSSQILQVARILLIDFLKAEVGDNKAKKIIKSQTKWEKINCSFIKSYISMERIKSFNRFWKMYMIFLISTPFRMIFSSILFFCIVKMKIKFFLIPAVLVFSYKWYVYYSFRRYFYGNLFRPLTPSKFRYKSYKCKYDK